MPSVICTPVVQNVDLITPVGCCFQRVAHYVGLIFHNHDSKYFHARHALSGTALRTLLRKINRKSRLPKNTSDPGGKELSRIETKNMVYDLVARWRGSTGRPKLWIRPSD